MESQINLLTRQRSAIKGKLTRFKHYVEALPATNIDIHNLNSRYEKIIHLDDEYDHIQSQIEMLLPVETEESDNNERTEFENSFYLVKASVMRLIENNSRIHVPQNNEPNTPQQVSRLPEIKIPTFDGKFSDWINFHDTFESVVENNPYLSNVNKFHYLKTSLRGEAARVIQTLTISEQNYTLAWSKLKERYEDKESIILKHVKCLFELTPITKESFTSLRQLADDVSNNLQAMSALDEPGQLADRLLIYMISSKLDNNTKREWECNIADTKAPSVDDILKFLINRAKLLEKINNERPISTHTKLNQNNHNSRDYRYSGTMKSTKPPNLSYVTTQNTSCGFCKGSHAIYTCQSFCDLPVSARIEELKSKKICFNCLRSGHAAQSCRSSNTCKKCNKRHNTLLHQDFTQDQSHIQIDQVAHSSATSLAMHSTQPMYTSTLLSTALVKIVDNMGNEHNCRALLDSGSQSHFISKRLCDALKLPQSKISTSIVGISQNITNIHSMCRVRIMSNVMNFHSDIQCLILSNAPKRVPYEYFNISQFKMPDNIPLADPQFYQPDKIDLIIGASLFWDLLCVGQIKLQNSEIILQKTKFGWIVSGGYSTPSYQGQCNISISAKIHKQIERFWELESFPESKVHLSHSEKLCEDHFIRTTTRHANGQFIVKIPFKRNVSELGDSHKISLKRFYSLERKLIKNPEMKQEYAQFLREYNTLGHMTELATDNQDEGYYLPHHAVLKDSSSTTKLRVVFDGSAKTTSGISLNDTQLVGPSLQNNLVDILIRFRQHQIAVKADITKMYRQILVDPNQRIYQKILWRANDSDPIKTYQLNTVTYGTASAPFLAIRALQQLAHEHKQQFPLASNIIFKDFYVDDLITGADTISAAKQIREQVSNILTTGGFELRKWASNEPSILNSVSYNNAQPIALVTPEVESTLGILWNHSTDQFQYLVTIEQNKRVTKRSILSETSKIFDPLGLVGPSIIAVKLIIQQLWQLQIGWDESIPAVLYNKWQDFKCDILHINEIRLPRCILNKHSVYTELHGFCDASEFAYGACIYIKTIDPSGNTQVNLVCAKSRVAPLKTISLPRLELCGALMLSQISKVVKNSLRNIKINREFYWTDSMITLSWISGEPTRWKQFVANRVSEIQELTNIANWRHVSSIDNPADIISRGLNPIKLKNSKLWWNGPQFLQMTESNWPTALTPNCTEIPEQKISCVYNITLIETELDFIHNYSCVKKLRRITAYMLRFINNCKLKTNPSITKLTGTLTSIELINAERALIRSIQKSAFGHDIHALEKHKQVHSKSKLLSLTPVLDSDHIIRVGGRIHNSVCSTDQKHPIVLPKSHHFTKLIIRNEHEQLLHAGVNATLASIRCRYWPIAGKNTVRQVLRQCIRCFRVNPSSVTPLMGNLPSCRLQPGRPFSKSGIDYAGPFLIKEGRYKHKRFVKAYIALFICMTTKAVHIELVSDLTTDAFLAMLHRFIARRGKVTDLFSDNGSCFIGANNQLKNLSQLFENEIKGNKIIEFLTEDNIKWHFQPPRAPNFGGLWERSIKSVKSHLKRVIGDANLSFEAFYTLLTQIEATLNSRPLTPLSNDPNDFTSLTPGHFLIGDVLTSPPHPSIDHLPVNRLSQWQHIERLRQHFWKRWSKEYISLLQQRTKWKINHHVDLQIGQLVILKEDNLPPLRWLLGRIIQLHPGEDGITRVVSVKTSFTVLKRPVSRVCVLPMEVVNENTI